MIFIPFLLFPKLHPILVCARYAARSRKFSISRIHSTKRKRNWRERGERNYKDIREIYGREEERGQRRMEAWST